MKKLLLLGMILLSANLFAQWHSVENTDLMTGESSYIFITEATEGENEYGRLPFLTIIIKDTGVTTYVNWLAYIDGATKQVTIKLDDAAPVSSQWGVSTTNTATFYPGNDIEFMNQLAQGVRLIVRVTPYRAPVITSIFPLAGLLAELEKYEFTKKLLDRPANP